MKTGLSQASNEVKFVKRTCDVFSHSMLNDILYFLYLFTPGWLVAAPVVVPENLEKPFSTVGIY